MESKKIVRDQIFEIVKNQMNSNNPPETNQTFERLKGLGYSDLDAKKLIGQCVAGEIFNILKYKIPFNEVRYVTNLKNLPKEPFED